MSTTADRLAALSHWIDGGQGDRDAEAVTWGRLAKVSEECGEVIAAYIGATGQNPRKGVTHDLDDVIEELLDVALTALCAVEHMTGANSESMDRLDVKVARVAARAGIEAAPKCRRSWQDDTVADLLTSSQRITAEVADGCPCPDEPHQNALHDLAHDAARILATSPFDYDDACRIVRENWAYEETCDTEQEVRDIVDALRGAVLAVGLPPAGERNADG